MFRNISEVFSFVNNDNNIYISIIEKSYIQTIRFGGALDESARQFSSAHSKGQTPLEFVTEMRNCHKYIQV